MARANNGVSLAPHTPPPKEQSNRPIYGDIDIYSNVAPPKIFIDIRNGRSVYIMALEDMSAVKIGISSFPPGRRGNIQSSNPKKLILAWNISLRTEDAELLEKVVHARLKSSGRSLRGEWYSMSVEYAREFIKGVIAEKRFSWMREFSDLPISDDDFFALKGEISALAPDGLFYRMPNHG